MLRCLPLFLLVVGSVHAQPASYGETTFPNSGAVEAQDAFLRGVLMLHSFEYEDAREAFQEARRIDPDFALAAWGESLTHNHPIWQDQDREAARAALDALAPSSEGRLAKAPTEREKDYLRTLEVLYGDGDKEERDFAYAEALGDLSARYPDDLDAASFYALAILGTAHEGRDFSIYMEAAAVAEGVFAANPRHPGAAHYLIHAYDDPVHAPLGLRPALVYDEIAPAASHALHMPSHIYFALGMWEDGAAMNVRSYDAAKARTDARGEPLNGHGWHALRWLHYAYLQQGRAADAEAILRQTDAWAEEDAMRARFAYATLRVHQIVETERPTPVNIPVQEGTPPPLVIFDAFAHGMSAYYRKDADEMEQALAVLQQTLATDEITEDPSPPLIIFGLELEALVALERGESEAALALLYEATALEDEMPLDFGPARPAKPAHELLGDVLLRLGEPDTAMKHYDETLARYPRRSRALLGLARAAAEAGDDATAQAAYEDLAHTWRDADPDLGALAEVREQATLAAQ